MNNYRCVDGTLLDFDGITFRQALRERPVIWWSMLTVWPLYLYGTLSDWRIGLVYLGLLSIPTAIMYLKWKVDNRPRTPWRPVWPDEPPKRFPS